MGFDCLECLGSKENRGGNRQKNYGEMFQKFLPIVMEHIYGSLYKLAEEWEQDDLVISADYSNSI